MEANLRGAVSEANHKIDRLTKDQRDASLEHNNLRDETESELRDLKERVEQVEEDNAKETVESMYYEISELKHQVATLK